MFTGLVSRPCTKVGMGPLTQEVPSGKSAEAEGMLLPHLCSPGLCQVLQEGHEDGWGRIPRLGELADTQTLHAFLLLILFISSLFFSCLRLTCWWRDFLPLAAWEPEFSEWQLGNLNSVNDQVWAKFQRQGSSSSGPFCYFHQLLLTHVLSILMQPHLSFQ